MPPLAPLSAQDRALYLERLWNCLKPKPIEPGVLIRAGLDLGTSSLVLTILDSHGEPLALARREARVVKDGLVVDFAAARSICESLRKELESYLGVSISQAALATPPGTSERDAATHGYVCQGAGMEVSAMFDEPQAANHLIGLSDGAIADLGGGTTGAALFKDSQTILSFDEPTGGHHLSLVIAGRFKIALEQAENIKLDPKRSREVASIVAPVLSKMGTILKRGFKNLPIPILWLVGGSSAAPGATQIISQETGLLVESLTRPELVTPAGIALGCPPFEAKALEK